MRTKVLAVETVAPDTLTMTLETPAGFTASPGQFVCIEAEIERETRSGYYALSSPEVTDAFEITVPFGTDKTLGAWLSACESGEPINVDGPCGSIQYTGDEGVTVVADHRGIGSAIGIAERARRADRTVAMVYRTDRPIYESRLDRVRTNGGTVTVVEEATRLADALDAVPDDRPCYVFGSDELVRDVRAALRTADYEPGGVTFEQPGGF
jgi:ferredoxin-NADP reductase